MYVEEKRKFLEIAGERIPVDKIKRYYIVYDKETEDQRKKRKADKTFNAALFGGFKGAVALTVPAIFPMAVLSAPAILAGAMTVGGIVGAANGKKKSEKKFEKNNKNSTLDHSTLIIELNHMDINKRYYCADSCGFDIYNKCKELDDLFGVNN